MIIRGSPEHTDAAWRILDQCRADLRARGIFQWDDVYPTRALVERDIELGSLYVALRNNIVCAVVTANEHCEPEYSTVDWKTSEPSLIVHRLGVDPSIQRQQLGAKLMDFVGRQAAGSGYRSIRLDAYSGNPASLTFYERLGYRRVGQVFFARRELPFWLFEKPV